jgi:hypothetical protein
MIGFAISVICLCGGMVDTVDSKSTASRRAGSSPAGGTLCTICTI